MVLTLALLTISVTAAGPSFVDISWMSMANLHYQIGSTGIITDGYITRIPQEAFFSGPSGLAQTRAPYRSNVDAVRRVLDAVGGVERVNLLFVVDGPGGRFSWFQQSSASAVDLDVPILVNGVDYDTPMNNLRAALEEAELDSVDLWIGTGGLPIAELVVPVLKPRAYLPIHWDGLWATFDAGMPRPFSSPDLEDYLVQTGVTLVKPDQFMDNWRLSIDGVHPVDNRSVKQALGFSNVQTF